MSQYETPNWDPLIDFLAGNFMWMHEVELADGTRLHAYKHRETRRYLHLSSDGRAFFYSADGFYCEDEAPHEVLDQVFALRH
ncbi:MAG: hypothetical protein WD827_02900 [Solirubrobacterales bacterium]